MIEDIFHYIKPSLKNYQIRKKVISFLTYNNSFKLFYLSKHLIDIHPKSNFLKKRKEDWLFLLHNSEEK